MTAFLAINPANPQQIEANTQYITIPQCQQQVYAKLTQQKERLCPYIDCSQPKARALCRDKCEDQTCPQNAAIAKIQEYLPKFYNLFTQYGNKLEYYFSATDVGRKGTK